jgi:hypothetical protein
LIGARSTGARAEPLLALAVLGAIAHAIWFATEYGHLPAPFFYDVSDTFMDWFNTAFWSHDAGAYDSWSTIYPPLSFVVLRLLSNPACYLNSEGLTARDCDWFGYVALGTILAVNFVLLWFTYRKLEARTAWPRTLALGLGLPMLYTLERGNILLLTFTCVILAFGPLVASARLRWLALGMAINFKVYLVAALAPQLLKRRWRWFEGALIATILVYLLSWMALGAGSPREIYTNIAAVAGDFEAGSLLDGWYAITYTPFMAILTGSNLPIVGIIGSDAVEGLTLLLPILKLFSQAMIATAAVATFLRPEAVPVHRATCLGVLMAIITSESGGYTQIILFFFIFMERWHGVARPLAIIIAYVLCIPADITIDNYPPGVAESWITGGPVFVNYNLSIGPFVRPLAVMMIAWSISALVIAEVRRDFAANPAGWRQRFSREPLAAR